MVAIDRRGLVVGDRNVGVGTADPSANLAVKMPVFAASTANIALNGLQTIDGVVLAEGDRVLVKNQTDQRENGIYNASSGNWTRTLDADSSSEWTEGLKVYVILGTLNGNRDFVCTSANPITLDSSNITFALIIDPDFASPPPLGVGIPNAVVGTTITVITSISVGGSTTSAIREKLTANRTYFVRTDGSDSNNGLGNTAAGAFLTIQHAIYIVQKTIDLAGLIVTIQVGNGTYNENLSLHGGLVGAYNSGSIIILGDTTTPSNVVINGSGGATFFAIGQGADWSIKGVKITNANSYCIWGHAAAWVRFTNVEIGACGAGMPQILADHRGIVEMIGDYKISAGADQHILTNSGGYVLVAGATVTLSGTPAFGIFAFALDHSLQEFLGVTFSGSATGQRFAAMGNSVINPGGTTLPGNFAGSAWNGGKIIGFNDDKFTTPQTFSGGLITLELQIEQAASAIGTGTKSISNAADSSTNFGHYFSVNLNGTVYYVPCGATAPT